MLSRFRRWALVGVALGALLYLALSLHAGLPAVADELRSFAWAWIVPILGLSLVNYVLRFAKWRYLLGRLGVRVPLAEDVQIFLAGLAMTITPGKAGEVLKPLLVRQAVGAPLTRTVPALVAERGTDALAVLGLAALGVTHYFAEGVGALLTVAAVGFAGLLVLASERLSLFLIGLTAHVPVVSKLRGRLEEMYRAMRTCLAPAPLVLTVALSTLAWGAECVGYLLILHGFGVESADLSVATFVYAFSQIAGAPSPGGLGVADTAMQEGALRLIAGISRPEALGSALICRLATLWLGVAIGGLVLLRYGASLGATDAAPAPSGEPQA